MSSENDGNDADQPWSDQPNDTNPGHLAGENPTPSQMEQGHATGDGPASGQSGQMYDDEPMVQPGSPVDLLSATEGKAALRTVVVTFSLVGIGVGLSLFLGSTFLGNTTLGDSETITAALSMFLYLGGPVLAVLIGLQGVTNVGDADAEAYVLSFVSTALGFFVMAVIASGFASLSILFFEFGEYLTASILLAIPTGFVAVGAVWASR